MGLNCIPVANHCFRKLHLLMAITPGSLSFKTLLPLRRNLHASVGMKNSTVFFEGDRDINDGSPAFCRVNVHFAIEVFDTGKSIF